MAGVTMPAFDNIQNALAVELKELSKEEQWENHYADKTAKLVLVQSIVRMHQKRKQLISLKKHYKENESSLIKVQALVRRNKEAEAYKMKKAFFKSNETIYEKVIIFSTKNIDSSCIQREKTATKILGTP